MHKPIKGFVPQLSFDSFRLEKENLQVGYLVYTANSELLFQDAQQKLHTIDKLFFLSQEWDFANGYKNLPKPYQLGETGEIKDYGANLIYTFLNSANSNIVILGQVMNISYKTPDENLDYQTNDFNNLQKKVLVRNNISRYFTVTEDGQGNLYVILKGKDDNGNFTLKIQGDKSQANGNVKLELNGKFILNQVTDKDELIAQLSFDNTEDEEKIKVVDKYLNKIELNKLGTIIETETVRIGKEETLKKILDDLITAIQNMTQPTAAGGPTIAPKFNNAEFIAIKNRLTEFMDVQ